MKSKIYKDENTEAFLEKVKKMNFPEMHHDMGMTEDEKRIRDTKRIFEVQIVSPEGKCINCNHGHKYHEHSKKEDNSFYGFYYIHTYKCKGNCKCKSFKGTTNTVKLCENGKMV